MGESLTEKIKRFVSFNEEMIDSAMNPENLKHQGLPSKILLTAIFDSLSKSRFPNITENGPRFKKTVAEHTRWCDCKRISLLHLVRAFEVAENVPAKFNKLRVWAEDLYQGSFRTTDRLISNDVSINQDPWFSEVEGHWPKTAEGKPELLGQIKCPEHLQHKNLLWLYRNSLMHEYRIPGQGAESKTIQETAPYYQEVSIITGLDSTSELTFTNHWELVYPTGFFMRLVREALSNIANYHECNNSSPFCAYTQGTYWLPPFNEDGS